MLIEKTKVRASKPRTIDTVLYANFSVEEGAAYYSDATQGTTDACTFEEALQGILASTISANAIFSAICKRYNALEAKAKK